MNDSATRRESTIGDIDYPHYFLDTDVWLWIGHVMIRRQALRGKEIAVTNWAPLENTPEDQFYALLGQPRDEEFHDVKTSLRRGREIFSEHLIKLQVKICEVYRSRPKGCDNFIDLAALFFTALQGDLIVAHVQVIPFVAILAKSKLDEICGE